MYKVLIADDEYFIRYGLENTIKWEEYGVEICASVSNGLEALEVIEKEEPDIVITDVKMPEMNGLELLREVRSKSLNTKVIVISGYNDFEYVKETLVYGVENYILKPIDEDELSETIVNAIAKIEHESMQNQSRLGKNNYIIENVFNRLVTNSIALREVQERFDFFDVDMAGDCYVVGLIKFIDEALDLSEDVKKSLISQVRHQLSDYKTHLFFDLAGNLVVLFCMRADQLYESIEEDVKVTINLMNETYLLDVFLTIGSSSSDISTIHVSYNSAVSLQEYLYIYSQNTRISHNKVTSIKKRLDDFFSMNIEDYRHNLQECNKHEVGLFFAELRQNAMSSKGTSLNYIRSFLIELVAVLINTIKDKELWKDKEVIYPDKLYEKLFGEGDIKTTIAWLKEISFKVIDSIAKDKSKPASLHQQVLAYIEENYHKELSLKVIAAEFYVNSSYLGQLFKKETGQLFSNYLNSLRIDKAKHLMDSSNLKASHIAGQVGYSDPNYFYKVFKKYTGMYPSEYELELSSRGD